MFNPADYKLMYSTFMGPLGQDIVLQSNNGTGFDDVATVKCHVSRWKETELVPNGSIHMGDLKLIIPVDQDGFQDMELKDRIQIDGRSYAVVQWDKNTRSIGESLVAIEATVRG